MNLLDLMAPSYPQSPGYKDHDTSKAAAAHIAPRQKNLQSLCLDAIKAAPNGLTADETAAILGKPIWSIRPRITDLVRLAEIHDSGLRRANESGCRAKVWIAGPVALAIAA
jgi:hypothetical protein